MSSRLVIPSLETLQSRVKVAPPTYKKPTEITHYSLDDHRKLRLDRSQLRQYQPAGDFYQYANIRHGFETFISKPEGLQEHLDVLMAACHNIEYQWSSADIVTWRGVITKMLCTPFLRDSWKFYGNVRNGTIFIEEEKQIEHFDRKRREFMYGGFKFETLCMVDPSADSVPMAERQSQIVNNNSEFGIVFSTALGKHRLVLGAEVDGLDADGQSYIELKTSAHPSSNNNSFMEIKLMKWWTQSFLAGIPKILVGYRNHKGWIDRLEEMPVDSIPRIVRGRTRWDPQAILAFGDLLFTWLRQMVEMQTTVPNDGILKFTLTCDPPIIGEHSINLEFNGPLFIIKE